MIIYFKEDIFYNLHQNFEIKNLQYYNFMLYLKKSIKFKLLNSIRI